MASDTPIPKVASETLLRQECERATQRFTDILRYKEQCSDVLPEDESPLQSWIVNQATVVLLYSMEKTSFLYGSMNGEGIAIARLDTEHSALIRWSAPLFFKISSRSGGISFGHQSVTTFAISTSSKAVEQLTKSPRAIRGFDVSVSCGSQLRERADVLSANFIPVLQGCLGISKLSGSAFDISFVSELRQFKTTVIRCITFFTIIFLFADGELQIDKQKCATAYGTEAEAHAILSGAIEPPQEFQSFYATLSRIAHNVERRSAGPARVSASLERFSTGNDPERRMVLPDGTVIREDLKEPPKE